METDMARLRNVIVDSPNSLGARSRLKRWELFEQYFPDVENMTVVDLGGRADTWMHGPIRPKHVVVINLSEFVEDTPAWISQRYGDACHLPDDTTAGDYDLVFSNSLIEHVGGHARRLQLARTVHTLADRHWVQTPYRYFPLEPHWLFPGFQFLPLAARVRIAQRWKLVHTPPSSYASALRSVMDTELLSHTEMSMYFPDSEVVREKIGPFTKSLIAVKTQSPTP